MFPHAFMIPPRKMGIYVTSTLEKRGEFCNGEVQQGGWYSCWFGNVGVFWTWGLCNRSLFLRHCGGYMGCGDADEHFPRRISCSRCSVIWSLFAVQAARQHNKAHRTLHTLEHRRTTHPRQIISHVPKRADNVNIKHELGSRHFGDYGQWVFGVFGQLLTVHFVWRRGNLGK